MKDTQFKEKIRKFDAGVVIEMKVYNTLHFCLHPLYTELSTFMKIATAKLILDALYKQFLRNWDTN